MPLEMNWATFSHPNSGAGNDPARRGKFELVHGKTIDSWPTEDDALKAG